MKHSKDFTERFSISINMASVVIREIEELQLTGKPIVQAFTGSGMVASIAAHHLVEDLGLKEMGYVQLKGIPPLVTVKDGRIQQPIRLYESSEIGLLMCETTIPQELIEDVINQLMGWYKSKDLSRVVVIGGLPTNRRNKGGSPDYYCVCNDQTVCDDVENKNLRLMENGAVYGSIAQSLLEAKIQGIPCLAILGECIATIPDYSATLVVLEALAKSLNLKISTEKLNKSASQLNEKIMSQLIDLEEQEPRSKSDTDTQYV
jgi:predicted ATP-grasp superfamily ATP-dependent carboligase